MQVRARMWRYMPIWAAIIWAMGTGAQEPVTTTTTTSAPFTWGSGNKLHIVRMPANQEELASIIYAVTMATEKQVHTLTKAEMQKGRITVEGNMYIVKRLQTPTKEKEKLGSLEGWTPRFGVARLDNLGPFSKEKTFEAVRRIARERNTENDAEMMILETYKDLRLLREDLQVIELHQYYILIQISVMVIVIAYKLVMMIREHNKERKHIKAITQRKERLELLRQVQEERPIRMAID